jgi:FKBP-type peptidyl-prolyl cis-trans isomerase SlyD
MKISNNKYVTVKYDLNVGDEGEELMLMERATQENPLEFIFGTNSMLEAFEKQLEGLSEGDTFKFTLTPEDAYGEYDENKVQELPKTIFEIDGKIDEEILVEGNSLPMMNAEGDQFMGTVIEVGDNGVTMDFNHPVAGEMLHFDGTVTSVREASVEEITAFFSQSGGGCGGCGDEKKKSCGGGC